MSTGDEQWWMAEAGEYVLGSLRGAERDLFERIAERDTDVAALVDFWEQHLYPLNQATPAVSVPEHIWPRIDAAINELSLPSDESEPGSRFGSEPGFESRLDSRLDSGLDPGSNRPIISPDYNVESPAAEVTAPAAPAPSAELHQLRKLKSRWKGVAAFAMAASIAMALLLANTLYGPDTRREYNIVSVIASEQGQGLWSIAANSENNSVRAVALSPPALAAGEVYELWLVLKDDAGVSSIGLLPTDSGAVLSAVATTALQQGAAFAVSQEPSGGSPLDVPSGPVVFSGPITAVGISL